jgi:ABC-type multidrug transport system fused ATPase/permease subunit
MGILEPITHKEEIEKLLNDAQTKYDASKEKFESQKNKTTRSLENLGKIKIDSWSTEMESFITAFSAFKNLEAIQNVDTNMSFIGSDESPGEMIINIQNASMTATEVTKAGVAAIGTGALVGIASYGGAMMFGSASTGTAIATLSGAAKTNATLAWFGGGSIKTGGLGIAGGKLILAGIVVAPIIAVSALITSAKSKEKLAEAKKTHEEAMDAVAKMEAITTGMQAVSKLSNNYSKFIKQLNKKFQPFIDEVNRIKATYATSDDELIDFDILTHTEQKTLHISWLMAQIYYRILSTPIMTESGAASYEATRVLKKSNEEMRQMRRDTFKMAGEEAQVGNILWTDAARKMIVINFAVMACFLILGCMAFKSNILTGLVYMVGSLIAFPFFFKFRNLPQSKLFMWRVIRVSVSVVFVVLILLAL